MAEYSGTALALTFGGTTLNADYRTCDWNEEVNTVSTTAGNDTDETHLTLTYKGNATVKLLAQTGGTIAHSIQRGDTGSLVLGPEGSTTGDPRKTVNAIATKLSVAHPFDNVVEETIEFLFSGAVTEDTF